MALSRRSVLTGSLSAAVLLATAACSSQTDTAKDASAVASSAGKVTVTHAQGTTEVPLNPKKVFSFDLGVLDTMEALGLEAQGVPQLAYPDSLKKYADAKYTKIGGAKEPDFEKIASEKPDLIIISTRAAGSYKELSKIAPTIDLTVDMKDQWASFKERAGVIGTIFGKEKEVAAKLAELTKEAESVKAAASSAGSALFLLVSGGAINAYGAGSRFGLIYSLLGLKPVAGVETKDAHGQAISSEFLKQKNPQLLYVLDRDAAIGQAKAGQSAKEVLGNELVTSTDAAKKDKITYVDGASWYLIGFGLNNASKMFAEIKSGL